MNPFRRRSAPRTGPAGAPSAGVSTPSPEPPDDGGPGTAAAEATFEMHEARRRIRDLEAELDRARRDAGLAAELRAAAAFDDLADRVATPLAHLATQVALVQAGGSVLTADDLATTAAGVIRALDRAGITVDGEVGATVPFDPGLHTPLRGGPAPGRSVVVRSPAVRAAGGRVVRKATVDETAAGPGTAP